MSPVRLVASLSCGALCFLTGCGTLARIAPGPRGTLSDSLTPYYSSMDHDGVVIAQGGDDWLGSHGDGKPCGWVVPFHILDLPISFATDTLCLPADLTMLAIKKRQEKKHTVDEARDH